MHPILLELPHTKALEKMMLVSAQSGLIWVFVASASESLFCPCLSVCHAMQSDTEMYHLRSQMTRDLSTMRYAGGI